MQRTTRERNLSAAIFFSHMSMPPLVARQQPKSRWQMSELGVRRDKAALSSGCKSQPAIAPAGSDRSRHGGSEMSEAFD
jgi:hypothetical protein